MMPFYSLESHVLIYRPTVIYSPTNIKQISYQRSRLGDQIILQDMTPVPRAHLNSLVTDMEAACSSGNLIQVKALLEKWYAAGKPIPEHMDLSGPHNPFSMVTAIENKRLEVIAYLMDEGFPIEAVEASAAARVGSVDIYQTFLDHGWNINGVPYGGAPSLK